MPLSNVVNKFHNKNGFTNTSTTEQSNFPTFHIRFQQVDDLNTGLKHLLMGGKVFKLRCRTMDWI